jgi:hypothetical protein
VKILRKGQELIYQWTGKRVLSHRAGAYLGDTNTIKALKQVGIVADASLSPAFASPLFREGYHANDIENIEGVLEIPVTYFIQMKLGHWESTKFLDIESSSLRELESVLTQMAGHDACAANIMMHSFSITRYGYPDERIINKLNALLKFIKNHPKLTANSTEEFVSLHTNNQLSCQASPSFVPYTGIMLTYLRSWERFSDGWKNAAVALSVPGFIFILAIVVIIGIKRRARKCL